MKRLFLSAALLALVSAPAAFAAKNQQTVSFPEAVTVGTTQLPAGDYNVTWTGTGSNVQLTLVQKNNHSAKPATFTAKEEAAANSQNSFITNRQGNVNNLEALQVGKTRFVVAASPADGQ